MIIYCRKQTASMKLGQQNDKFEVKSLYEKYSKFTVIPFMVVELCLATYNYFHCDYARYVSQLFRRCSIPDESTTDICLRRVIALEYFPQI